MAHTKYKIGGFCKNGHRLTVENTSIRRQHGNGNDYLVCKPCKAATDDQYRRANQEKIQAKQLAWSKNNPARKWRNARRSRFMREYGITLEQFEAIQTQQNGKCAICHEVPVGLGPAIEKPHWLSLYVDHDHKTGVIRGLLCWNCNIALGHFRDDLERLRAAIQYLESGRPAINLSTSSVDACQSPLN